MDSRRRNDWIQQKIFGVFIGFAVAGIGQALTMYIKIHDLESKVEILGKQETMSINNWKYEKQLVLVEIAKVEARTIINESDINDVEQSLREIAR